MQELLQQLKVAWSRLGGFQRMMIVGVFLTCIAVFGGLTLWAQKPKMQLLFGGLGPEDASRVAEKVSEAGCEYELRNGGSAVVVPADRVYELRLALAAEGVPSSDQPGYKLFDEEKITVSPFVQQVNFARALEGELARTIQLLNAISFARVHIVRPEPSLFAREEKDPAATVVVKLAGGGRLTQSNVAAITHLVAGGVRGLTSDKVVVVDARGNLLSGRERDDMGLGASTALEYRTKVEEYLAGKAERMLLLALGPGRASVKVSADLEMQSRNTTKVTYLPKGKVPEEEEITTSSSAGAGSVGGAADGAPSGGAGSTSTDKTIKSTFKISQEQETVIDIPGTIKKLTIAAFVDLAPPVAETAEGEEASPPMKMPTIEEVESIIKNAVGFVETGTDPKNKGRADELKVVNVPFHRGGATAGIEAEIASARRNEFLITLARNASLGVLAVAALLAMRMLMSRRDAPAATPGEVQPGGSLPGVAGGDNETNERTYLLNQINHALRENPQDVQKLFLDWVEEAE